MRKRLIFFVLFAICTINLSAQSVGQMFYTIPDSLCPFLDIRQRYILLEYARTGTTDTVVNLFGGKTAVRDWSDNYLSVQITEGVNYDFYYDTCLTFIQTACAPICHSIVKRYSKDWNLLEVLKQDNGYSFTLAEIKDGQLVFTDMSPILEEVR